MLSGPYAATRSRHRWFGDEAREARAARTAGSRSELGKLLEAGSLALMLKPARCRTSCATSGSSDGRAAGRAGVQFGVQFERNSPTLRRRKPSKHGPLSPSDTGTSWLWSRRSWVRAPSLTPKEQPAKARISENRARAGGRASSRRSWVRDGFAYPLRAARGLLRAGRLLSAQSASLGASARCSPYRQSAYLFSRCSSYRVHSSR